MTIRQLILLFLLTISTRINAQVPQKMSYQAVVRNSAGVLVKNTSVGVRISIVKDSANGTEIFKEKFDPNPMTNSNGLISIEIGGGIPVNGTFSNIDWSKGPYFVKSEFDPNGGTNYSIVGTSQLLSVPYALYAGNLVNSSNNGGKTYLVLSGNISDSEAALKISRDAGPNTQFVLIQNTSRLTTVDLSALSNLIDLKISDNLALNTVNVSSIQTCETSIFVSKNAALATLYFQSLIYAGSVNINQNSSLSSISFPVVKTLNSLFLITQNPVLSALNMNSLSNSADITITSNTALSSINLTQLDTVNGSMQISNVSGNSLNLSSLRLVTVSLYITNNSNLASIDLSNLTKCTGYLSLSGNKLTNVSMPSLSTSPTTFTLQSNKLPSSQINFWLAKMLTLTPGSGRAIYLNQQSPSAPPTGQGITDKASLISAGNTVTTD